MKLEWKGNRGHGRWLASLPDGSTVSYWRSTFEWESRWREKPIYDRVAVVSYLMTWPGRTNEKIIRGDLAQWAAEKYPLEALASLAEKEETA